MNILKNDHISIPIPYYKMGWLIGKNGYSINYICKETKTNIFISDNIIAKFGSNWKMITIRGNCNRINDALILIYMRLDEYIHKPRFIVNSYLNNKPLNINAIGNQEMYGNYYLENNIFQEQQYICSQNQQY